MSSYSPHSSDAQAKALVAATNKAAETTTSANDFRTKSGVQRTLAENSVATLKQMETALLKCEAELGVATQEHGRVSKLKNPAAGKLVAAKATMAEAQKKLDGSLKNRDDMKSAAEQQAAEAETLARLAEDAERAAHDAAQEREVAVKALAANLKAPSPEKKVVSKAGMKPVNRPRANSVCANKPIGIVIPPRSPRARAEVQKQEAKADTLSPYKRTPRPNQVRHRPLSPREEAKADTLAVTARPRAVTKKPIGGFLRVTTPRKTCVLFITPDVPIPDPELVDSDNEVIRQLQNELAETRSNLGHAVELGTALTTRVKSLTSTICLLEEEVSSYKTELESAQQKYAEQKRNYETQIRELRHYEHAYAESKLHVEGLKNAMQNLSGGAEEEKRHREQRMLREEEEKIVRRVSLSQREVAIFGDMCEIQIALADRIKADALLAEEKAHEDRVVRHLRRSAVKVLRLLQDKTLHNPIDAVAMFDRIFGDDNLKFMMLSPSP